MHISYFTHPGGLETSTGFGYAGFNIVTALQALGHKVTFDDPDAPVQLEFTQPNDYTKRAGQLAIGYTPWESTELKPEWIEHMDVPDLRWCTSELNKQWFEELGYTVDGVFHHGITHNWTPRRRKVRNGKIRFLHVGEPAPRKSGQMVFDAFINLFRDNPDYSLTIKGNQYNTIRHDPKMTGVLMTPDQFSNVRLMIENITEEQMVSLFHSHDVLVYPSWGEGFGFIPLQALATGMPTIMNTTWAPYEKFTLGLNVEDRLVQSPWPDMHPGKMLEPSQESVEKQMIEVAENFNYYSLAAYRQAEQIHQEYDWRKVCNDAFAPLEEAVSKGLVNF